MIQDIFPSKLYNAFQKYTLRDADHVLQFRGDGCVLLKMSDPFDLFLRGEGIDQEKAVYLFSVDEERYFLITHEAQVESDGYEYRSLREIRDLVGVCADKDVYVMYTAYHLWRWYTDNRFCGRCGKKMGYKEDERAVICPDCGNVVYPRINPAVIVGVTNGDRILITKYRTGFAFNALVAGFTEIGETFEECVAREVMEETGIKVKNIRYYKSQPWGMALDILAGFYCDVDGDDTIRMDANELKYAEWVGREDIVLQPNNLSLTNEMMNEFKEGRQ